MTDEGFTAEELVQACNKILVYAGLVSKVANIEEVRLVCSSTGLFVAALEGFLRSRLPDAIRAPTTAAEHAYNNILVIEVLSQVLSTDLSHISGERIAEGSIEDISNLLELLAALCHGKPLQGPPAPDPPENEPLSPGRAESGRDSEDDAPPLPKHGPAPQRDDGDPTDASDAFESEHLQEDDGADEDASPSGRPGEHSQEHSDEHQRRQHQEVLLQQRLMLRQLLLQQQPQLQEARQCIDSGSEQQRRSPGPRAPAVQRPPRQEQEAAPDFRPLLSPILETSREGRDSARAAKEPSGAVARKPTGSTRGRRETAAARRGNSSGGNSSAISIPSDVGGGSQCSSHHGGITYPAAEQPVQSAWPVQAAVDERSDDPPSHGSSSTLTLLERALQQAETTLRGMGREYGDFYCDGDQDVKKRSRRSRGRSQRRGHSPKDTRSDPVGSRGSGPAAFKPARRDLRAGARPDGGTGTLQQQKAFLRRVKRALTGETGTSTNGSDHKSSKSSMGRKTASSSGGRSSGGPGSDTSTLRKPATRGGLHGASATEPKRSSARRAGSNAARDDGHAALLRVLQGGGLPSADSLARHGRKLLQRTASAYGAALPLGPPDREEWGMSLPAAVTPSGRPNMGMSLSAELESKLRYVYRLAKDHPKQRAARAAIQQLALAEDLLRQVRRREMVDRLSSARARREAALRLTSDRLHEQNAEYERRIEQLRLQRLAAEWDARHRSVQMKRALQAELAMREAFLDVLESEKEVLLAERRRAKEEDMFSKYQSVMRKAEREYLELYNTLENLLAAERQQRVRASREALQAQRQESQMAAAVVQDRMQELLGRVAREDEAILQRYSIATRPHSREVLVGQIRRLLGLT